MVKNQPAMQENWVQSLVWEDSGEKNGYPIWYSCLENPHGQKNLVGYSPWGHKESDTTEQLSTAHSKHKIVLWEAASGNLPIKHRELSSVLRHDLEGGCRESRREVQERGDVLYI